ncbi:MAG: substrate-binding domain-containing protein [Candidatus Aenigmatarchaeota archaeon]
MTQEPKKIERRSFLNYAIAIIATGVVVGTATYFAVPKGVETVTAPGGVTTFTKTVTVSEGTGTTTPFMLSPFDIRTNEAEWVDTKIFRKDPPWIIGICTAHRAPSWMAIWLKEIEAEIEGLKNSEPGLNLVEKVISVDSASDVSKEVGNMRDLVAAGADAIILDPVDPKGSAPIVEEVVSKGIPVILPKNYCETNKYTAYSNNDEVQFGYTTAKWLAEKLGGKGNILVFRGIPGYGVDLQRWAGAELVFNQYPNIKILASEYGQWDYTTAKKLAADMLAAHPKFDGIWSMGGQMSAAMVDAMLEAGYDVSKYPHAGEDYNGFCKQIIKYNIPACMSCKPVWEGRIGVRNAFDALRGLPIRKNNVFPSPFFSAEDAKKIVRSDLPDQVWVSTTLPDQVLKQMFA